MTTNVRYSITPSQPFRFLDVPLEIRLMIYELLVASDQPIQIDCDHAKMGQSSESLKVRLWETLKIRRALNKADIRWIQRHRVEPMYLPPRQRLSLCRQT